MLVCSPLDCMVREVSTPDRQPGLDPTGGSRLFERKRKGGEADDVQAVEFLQAIDVVMAVEYGFDLLERADQGQQTAAIEEASVFVV